MLPPSLSSPRRLLAIAALAVAGAAAALVLLPPRNAEAQGVMSAPACQCSTPTPLPGIRSAVVHCLCGAMSCAITEYQPSGGGGTQQMQCVR